jgi:conjugative transfer signal peptidase TraF
MWIERLAVLWLGVCAAPVALDFADLEIVYTPSVPRGVYRMHDVRARKLERGDYVCLEGWRAAAPEAIRSAARDGQVPLSWVQGERLTKLVAGIPGDRITYAQDAQGGHLEINGVRLPRSTALEHDSAGAKLARPKLPHVLQDGEVWLSSEHERGFDSRYFGPVKIEALACRAELRWKW